MKNVLIGGTGFIGSALARELLNRGEEVVSISRSGQAIPEGVTPLALDLYAQSIPQDQLAGADTVFILLGQNHPGFDSTHEDHAITQLASNLQHTDADVFYFSTANVYGDTPEKATEETTPHPYDAYGRFKLKAEAILAAAIPTTRLTILRPTNVYGTPGNKGFIGLLMRKLADPAPAIELNGDGQQRRDFLFIDDLIQATLAIRNQPKHRGIVNVSTATSYSLIEVVELASKIAGKKIDYTVTHKPLNGPLDNQIDNTRLTQTYGYKAITPLQDGLIKTFQSYQEINHATH